MAKRYSATVRITAVIYRQDGHKVDAMAAVLSRQPYERQEVTLVQRTFEAARVSDMNAEIVRFNASDDLRQQTAAALAAVGIDPNEQDERGHPLVIVDNQYIRHS